MSRKFQLTIPEPCHEDWNKMQPEEKGRFCSSCQKGVMDFTGMSDQQLIAFFKKPSTGSLCGRFNHDQLNHDFEIPRKRIPWLKYFFTIAVPAFLASNKAEAQGQVRKVVKKEIAVPKCSNEIMGDIMPVIVGELVEMPVRSDSATISGRVIDENGLPLSYATIMIKGTRSGTHSDVNGFFKVKASSGNNTIIASYVGYEAVEKNIGDSSNAQEIILGITLKTQVLGAMVTIGMPSKQKPIPLIQRIFRDTSFKNFKFYPNPATPGSVITIEWKKQEAGEFEIQLLNQEGQIVNRKTENFVEKTNAIQYNIPSVAAGNYFLVMTNRKTQKRITEKIIIQ